MPELPEVETIKNQLNESIKNGTTEISYSKLIGSIIKRIPKFCGMKITILNATQKFHNGALNNKFIIQSGLGMSGWRLWNEIQEIPHTHMIIKCTLEDNKIIYLAYVDPRRFGKCIFSQLKNGNKKNQPWE